MLHDNFFPDAHNIWSVRTNQIPAHYSAAASQMSIADSHSLLRLKCRDIFSRISQSSFWDGLIGMECSLKQCNRILLMSQIQQKVDHRI